jgi:hypothetical protein
MLIYSASPFMAFLKTLLIPAGLLVLGAIALFYALSQRRQAKKGWLGLGIAGSFLCLMGTLILAATFANMFASPQTVTARLTDRRIAEVNCSGTTCTKYILGMSSAPKTYDFTVVKQAYDATHQGDCYQVVYYPNKSLFATDYGTDLYIATAYITRIIGMQPGA